MCLSWIGMDVKLKYTIHLISVSCSVGAFNRIHVILLLRLMWTTLIVKPWQIFSL